MPLLEAVFCVLFCYAVAGVVLAMALETSNAKDFLAAVVWWPLFVIVFMVALVLATVTYGPRFVFFYAPRRIWRLATR